MRLRLPALPLPSCCTHLGLAIRDRYTRFPFTVGLWKLVPRWYLTSPLPVYWWPSLANCVHSASAQRHHETSARARLTHNPERLPSAGTAATLPQPKRPPCGTSTSWHPRATHPRAETCALLTCSWHKHPLAQHGSTGSALGLKQARGACSPAAAPAAQQGMRAARTDQSTD